MAPTDGIKSEFYFNSSTELQNQYGTYENYKARMMEQLKSTPLWLQGKIAYQNATEKYNNYMTLFGNLKAQQDRAQDAYQSSLLAYMKQNNLTDINQVPSGILNGFKSAAGLTADLIKNTSDAELAADLALDARFRAVDMQRHGLYFNG